MEYAEIQPVEKIVRYRKNRQRNVYELHRKKRQRAIQIARQLKRQLQDSALA